MLSRPALKKKERIGSVIDKSFLVLFSKKNCFLSFLFNGLTYLGRRDFHVG
jgi:hypothetical protein